MNQSHVQHTKNSTRSFMVLVKLSGISYNYWRLYSHLGLYILYVFSDILDPYFFLISPLFSLTLALPFAYKRFDGTHIREVISLKQSYIFSNIKSLFFYAPGPCPASLLCFLVIFYHQSGTMRMTALEERRADTAWFLHQLWVLNSLDFKLHEKNDFISVSCSFLSK